MRPFRDQSVPAPPHCAPPPQHWLSSDVPLDLEIGCGVGWHPITYAIHNPDRRLIAIERTKAKFARFSSRLAAHPKQFNLLPVNADAVSWVTHFLPERSLSRVFLLYPNPYPKNPAQRWFRMPFFATLLGRLRPDGRIFLSTNIKDYWEEANQQAQELWGLHLVGHQIFTRETNRTFQPATHFERKYFGRGECLYRGEFSL